MAWLQADPAGNYHVSFRFGGRKFKRSLRTKSGPHAEGRRLRLEEWDDDVPSATFGLNAIRFHIAAISKRTTNNGTIMTTNHVDCRCTVAPPFNRPVFHAKVIQT